MDRPSSRGAAAPSRSGLRTGSLRTAAGGGAPNYGGVGLNTNVSVAERPVTQHGMGGMRVGTAGPKRQVQDTSYFIGLLRGKCAEIGGEIGKLKKEADKFAQDNSSYTKYERQYEELIKMVRQLEGKLADYNLAMDKARDSTDPEDVRAYQQQLAARNAQEKKTVDSIFLERQRCEEAVRAVEDKISKQRQLEEYKVGQLSEGERTRYHALAQELTALQRTVAGRSGELDSLRKRVKQGEMALENDHLREEYHQLSRQLDALLRDKGNLQTELEASKLDPAEARQRMLDKVKADNARIQELQRQAEEADREAESKRKQAVELAQELEERRAGAGAGQASRGLGGNGGFGGGGGAGGDEGQKYEALFARDQEMTQFLQGFDEAVLKELEEHKKAQRMIVGLLEHTSRHLGREGALPNEEQLGEMRDSLSFKKKALESSQSTQEQLHKELEKRRGELDKVNTLDTKIEVELKSLTARIDVMKSEMVQFVKIDELRAEADRTREELIGTRKEYQKRRDQIKAQVALVQARHDKRKSALADDETARTIEGLEQKLRHHEQNIFHLNEFIVEKELETNFQGEREECGRIIDELNALHIQAAAASF